MHPDRFLALYLAARGRVIDTLRRDDGASMVEYALLVAFIVLVAISAIIMMGGEVSERYSEISSDVTAF